MQFGNLLIIDRVVKHFLLLFFITVYSFSYANQVDSLLQVLPKLEGISKAEALNRLVWSLKYSDPKSAIAYGNESVQLARSLKDNEQLSASLLNLSIVYSIKAEYDSSNVKIQEALEVYQSIEDLLGMAKCWNTLGLNEQARGDYTLALKYFKQSLNQFSIVENEKYMLILEANIGSVYYHLGKYDSALTSYYKIVDYARETSDEKLLVNNLTNVGSTYSQMGNYPEALKALFEAQEIWESRKDSVGMANVMNEIALIFNYIEMYDKAKETLGKAMNINKRLGNKRQLAMNSNNIAVSFKNTGDLDSALYYYYEALRNYKEVGVKTIGNVTSNIGLLHFKNEAYDTAEYYFTKSLKINTELGKEDGIAHDKANLAKLYIHYEQFDEAEKLLLESYDYWYEQKKFKELTSVAEKLVQIYKTREDYESVAHFQDILKEAEDSVFGHQKRNELTKVLVAQLLKEEMADIDVGDFNTNKNEKSRTYLVFGFIVTLLLLVIVWFWMRNRKSTNRLKLDLDQKNRELTFLSLSVMQKDEFIQNFTKQLKLIDAKGDQSKELQKLLKNLKVYKTESNHWDHFKEAFEQIAPHFFDELLKRYPKLSNKELRLCALVRLNIPFHEIARILGISLESVHKARYRLKKRFQLEGQNSLESLLAEI